MYQYGLGVQKDYKEALKWYMKSAEQGNMHGQNNVGFVYMNGEGVPKDCKEALKWFHKAADQGFVVAINSIGSIYEIGCGVPKDYKEAIKWYRKAAELGNASAQFSLGKMYHTGLGVPEDREQALKWYRRAAEKGNKQAKTTLELMDGKVLAQTTDGKGANIATQITKAGKASTEAKAQDESKRVLAEELLNLMNVKDTQEQALAMVKQMISAQIQKMNPTSEDSAVQARVTTLMEKTMDMVRDEMSWDRMKEEYITLYSETYTEPELKDMIAFYKTPSGQAFIKKQPEVLRRSLELSQKVMGGLMPKIQAMTNEFKKDVQSQPPPKPEGN